MVKKKKKATRKHKKPAKRIERKPFLSKVAGNLRSSIGNFSRKGGERGVAKIEILSGAVIECGIVLLLILAIMTHASVTTRQSMIFLLYLIGLPALFIRKKIHVLEAGHGRLCLVFVVLFAYSVVIEKSLRISISEGKTALVPYAVLILLAITSAAFIKVIRKKESISLMYGVLTPFAITVAMIVILGVALNVFLSTVYPIEFFNLLHIYRQILQYFVLYIVISNFVTAPQRIKRVSIYIFSASLILIVLKVGAGL